MAIIARLAESMGSHASWIYVPLNSNFRPLETILCFTMPNACVPVADMSPGATIAPEAFSLVLATHVVRKGT